MDLLFAKLARSSVLARVVLAATARLAMGQTERTPIQASIPRRLRFLQQTQKKKKKHKGKADKKNKKDNTHKKDKHDKTHKNDKTHKKDKKDKTVNLERQRAKEEAAAQQKHFAAVRKIKTDATRVATNIGPLLCDLK